MDPLDDVFAAMRLKSALYARLTAFAPWGISFIKSRSIRFGYMLTGDGWLEIEHSQTRLRLRQGEGFIVQPGRVFSLRDNPHSPVRWCEDIFSNNPGNDATFGGEDDGHRTPAGLLCGYLTFDATGAEPLLSLLPEVVIIPADETRSPLLEATLQMLALETTEGNLGSRIVVSRLADVLFVQAIRAHCLHNQLQQGWLAALADAKLGAVIRRIHQEINHPWTLGSLAAQAGMSRSAFAVHFKTVSGQTPGDYLTRWRLYRARCLLSHAQLSLSTIAERVGYDSAITLGRAFKRAQGITPGDYRRQIGIPPRGVPS